MYTRGGDKGETSLFGPKRVTKDDPRVEAYGTIDELNSLIGVAIASSRNRDTVSSLREVQALLFVAGADAASELGGHQKVRRISAGETAKIEKMTDSLLTKLPSLSNFIFPGGTSAAATLQLARAVCRRAERRIVAATKVFQMNPELVPFFNRLSSYLFNLSRWENKRAGKKETVWKS